MNRSGDGFKIVIPNIYSLMLEIAPVVIFSGKEFTSEVFSYIVLERCGKGRNDGRNEAPEVDLHFRDGAYADADEHNQNAQLGAAAKERLVQNRLERARRRDDGELGNLSLREGKPIRLFMMSNREPNLFSQHVPDQLYSTISTC